jgi:HAE1 family hydrophobic/amphiphilic exporter-1
VVSAFVSLTLTPMMCARFLKDEHRRQARPLYKLSSAASTRCSRATSAGSTGAAHQFITLMVFFATLALTVVLFVIIPKGFFPQQDTGFIFGIARRRRTSRSPAMNRRQQAFADIIRQDPDVAGVAMFGNGVAVQHRQLLFIALKPKDEPQGLGADEIIARLRPKLAQVEGARCSCRPARTSTSAAAWRARSTSTRCTDANLDELNDLGAEAAGSAAAAAAAADVATDQQNARRPPRR